MHPWKVWDIEMDSGTRGAASLRPPIAGGKCLSGNREAEGVRAVKVRAPLGSINAFFGNLSFFGAFLLVYCILVLMFWLLNIGGEKPEVEARLK